LGRQNATGGEKANAAKTGEETHGLFDFSFEPFGKTTDGLAGKIFPRTNGRYNGGCRQANYMLVIFTLRPAGR
jgi:hypothetical protein